MVEVETMILNFVGKNKVGVLDLPPLPDCWNEDRRNMCNKKLQEFQVFIVSGASLFIKAQQSLGNRVV